MITCVRQLSRASSHHGQKGGDKLRKTTPPGVVPISRLIGALPITSSTRTGSSVVERKIAVPLQVSLGRVFDPRPVLFFGVHSHTLCFPGSFFFYSTWDVGMLLWIL